MKVVGYRFLFLHKFHTIFLHFSSLRFTYKHNGVNKFQPQTKNQCAVCVKTNTADKLSYMCTYDYQKWIPWKILHIYESYKL